MNKLLITACALVAQAFALSAYAQEAQTGGGAGPGGGGTSGGGGTQGQTQGGTGQGSTSSVPIYPGAVAPPPPGVPLGGGNNVSSSSQTYSGGQEDHFDSDPTKGGASVSTLYGNSNGAADFGHRGGSFTMGEGPTGIVPDSYTVRRGDTLWGICDTFFRNPYQWPRIWSYNPQIQNPHWIYPGDEVKLHSGNGTAPQAQHPQQQGGNLVDRRRQVVPQTIFLRDTGFVSDDDKDDWGEINGSAEDKMFLTQTDEAYMRLAPGHEVKLGQELTVFRPVRKVSGGNLVQIQGTVRIDRWDPSTHIARGLLTESLDVIERGARIGPVGRKFEVVPPIRNEKDVNAQVLASVYPHNFYGQNQVVFIDKGVADGLKIGNRLFVVRRGDAWRKSLASDVAGLRIALESDSPADIEQPPTIGDSKAPLEYIGELRVLTTRNHTSACLVSQSTKEIELGDSAIARKGY
jgi:LysM domain